MIITDVGTASTGDELYGMELISLATSPTKWPLCMCQIKQ